MSVKGVVSMYGQLLNQIRLYLDDQVSIADLETWLVAHLNDILSSGDKNAEYIANELNADLVWLQEGLITESEFKAKAKKLINPISTTNSNFTLFETTDQWLLVSGESAMVTERVKLKTHASSSVL